MLTYAAPIAAPKRKSYANLDMLRVCCMLAVVFLHSAAEGLRTNLGSSGWHVLNLITALFTTAVPLFFMISGAAVLSSSNTLSYAFVLKKRIPRLIIPLFMWSVVSVLKDTVFAAINNPGAAPSELASVFFGTLKGFTSNPVAIHFWFMYTLIPIYLLSPLLKAMVDGVDRGTLFSGLSLWGAALLLGSVSQLLPKQLGFLTNITFVSNLKLLGGYIGYFVLGYALQRYTPVIRSGVLTVCAGASVAVITAGTVWRSLSAEAYAEEFKSYVSIYVLVLSVSLFLLAARLFAGTATRRAVSYLAALSFGLYLSHNIFISVLYRFCRRFLPFFSGTGVISVIGCFAVTSVFCLLITMLLASLKPLCYIFTGLPYASAAKSCNLRWLAGQIKASSRNGRQ